MQPRLVVLVTGASGFVGSALVARLATEQRFAVRGTVRAAEARVPPGVERVAIGNLADGTGIEPALESTEVVVHLAARAHILHDAARDPLAEFRRVNVAGTVNLARTAAAAGVKRFVFISSLKVHGESGGFRETDTPVPEDAYGTSKHEAERGLRTIGRETGMEIVIVRPPLVYGPGVKANFLALANAVRRGFPLPFGAVRNRRSLVALDNLNEFVTTCIVHPAAANETFLVSDGEDLSTPELIRRIARAMDRTPRLVPVPPGLLAAAARVVGRRDLARRLLGSLWVDITKSRRVLGWNPPVDVDEGLRRVFAAL